MLAAIFLALLLNPSLSIIISAYVAIQLAYCFGLKHEPVFELASVASGFLLRAMAGGVAAGIELSQWFLLTAAFGSFFMASGKRYAESRAQADRGHTGRPVIQKYTTSYLRFVWTVSATAVIMTYALWAFEVGQQAETIWSVLSLIPFCLAILRYAVDVDAGEAEEPDEIVRRDRVLLFLGLIWVCALLAAVYL